MIGECGYECKLDCHPWLCEIACQGLEGVDLHHFANIEYEWFMSVEHML